MTKRPLQYPGIGWPTWMPAATGDQGPWPRLAARALACPSPGGCAQPSPPPPPLSDLPPHSSRFALLGRLALSPATVRGARAASALACGGKHGLGRNWRSVGPNAAIRAAVSAEHACQPSTHEHATITTQGANDHDRPCFTHEHRHPLPLPPLTLPPVLCYLPFLFNRTSSPFLHFLFRLLPGATRNEYVFVHPERLHFYPSSLQPPPLPSPGYLPST